MNKIPVSAIVVSKNEGALLEQCLKSIQFCDEIVVIDLSSTDQTVDVARRLATSCLTIDPIPLVEIIHEKYIPGLRYEWVLITDPDEVCSVDLQKEIIDRFDEIASSSEIGAVKVPLRYYFKDHLLAGTPWGGISTRHYLAHRARFVFSSHIHQGRKLAENYRFEIIKFTGANFIHHYWMTGFGKFISKHRRYLRNEGKSRYELGQRTSCKEIMRSPWKEFKFSYKSKQGRKDGQIGFFLSILWAWYQTNALRSLYRYQRSQKH